MIHIKELSGHSGCSLNLYKDEEGVFLRKDAGDNKYNKRLKKQCLKQKLFKSDILKTPRVLRYGYNKKRVFYFDMEYVNGISMAEYMHQIKIKEIVDLTEVLFKTLTIGQGKIHPKCAAIFKEKIASLTLKFDYDTPLVTRALEKLNRFDFTDIPLSPCCGDLTLENIILSSSGIYVIDLLDSFYNSWMIDVAKLLQDIELGWAYRYQEKDMHLNLRLEIAKKSLLENLNTLENGKENVLKIYHILLLNVLRIYPYAKDDITIDFLNSSVDHVLTTIDEMEAL